MSIFVVDQDKCTKCGICQEVCPVEVIELKDNDSFPTASKREICINCGHCLAACPHDALSLDKMPLDQCQVIPEGWSLSTESIETLYRSRRSIRIFKDKPVDREILNKLINICRYAPSAHNKQPVRWVVVSNPDEMKRIIRLTIDFLRYIQKKEPLIAKLVFAEKVTADYDAGLDPICLNAPHVIFTHVPVKNIQLGPYSNLDDLANGIIAATYMELALPSFGLGGCWAGYINIALSLWPPLRNALNIPKAHVTTSAILVGYPKYRYHRLPLRNEADITWK